jgi:hypothetical protein
MQVLAVAEPARVIGMIDHRVVFGVAAFRAFAERWRRFWESSYYHWFSFHVEGIVSCK